MAVIVMEVKSAAQHPRFQRLTILDMEAPDRESFQIVVNPSELSCQIGDRLAIAMPGSVLKDGTKTKPAMVKGIAYNGTVLEKTEETLGTDLTSKYCLPNLTTEATHFRWTNLEFLHNICLKFSEHNVAPRITYRAKDKLDGTNAAVQIFPDGRVAAQSRNRIITPDNDNQSFATWVAQNVDHFSMLACDEHLTIYGEWCGKGIIKRTAISFIPRRIYAIFTIRLESPETGESRMIYSPEGILERISISHPDIFVLPFWGEPVVMDFADPEQLESATAIVNNYVDIVEETDPWVEATFGNQGLGEGIVLYPDLIENLPEDCDLPWTEMMFKAKGMQHRMVNSRRAAQTQPETAGNVEEFVTLFLTQTRLEQGISEACEEPLDMKQTGAFLKWLTGDVKKESAAELEASNLKSKWGEIHNEVMVRGKNWFLAKC